MRQQSLEMTSFIVTLFRTKDYPTHQIPFSWSACVSMDGDKKEESAIPGVVTEVVLEASCLKCQGV